MLEAERSRHAYISTSYNNFTTTNNNFIINPYTEKKTFTHMVLAANEKLAILGSKNTKHNTNVHSYLAENQI